MHCVRPSLPDSADLPDGFQRGAPDAEWTIATFGTAIRDFMTARRDLIPDENNLSYIFDAETGAYLYRSASACR